MGIKLGVQSENLTEEVVTYRIRCGGITPPKKQSANVKGEGTLELGENSIVLTISAERAGLATLYAVLATILTMLIASLFNRSLGIWMVRSIFFWLPFCFVTIRRRIVLRADPQKADVYYIPKREIACLELTTGKWIGIKSEDKKQRSSLLKSLERFYGDRLAHGH